MEFMGGIPVGLSPMLDVALEPTGERAERCIAGCKEMCFNCLGEVPPRPSRVQRPDIGRGHESMIPVRMLGWSATRNDPARRRQEERPQLLHVDEVKAETSHPFGPGGKGTAGELPAEPLEAVLEDEARDDEEVDESSSLESPELPGPGPDPPRVAVWPLGEERAGCAGERRKAADPAECAGPAEGTERVDATEAEREPDRGCGGVWKRDGERGGRRAGDGERDPGPCNRGRLDCARRT
ncbi:hypothetical protein PR002_g18612 [Phytophthora rubi]|uniref:Uncharacterized protein n=1 Tax=Phytophthora rubi TaxID=129364 RepID=A0A6A3K018_9STRA|nr:hypothetical protein PR002_g18612 [Phytophthora rubi]